MYFFYYGGRIILTNGFIKRPRKHPRVKLNGQNSIGKIFWKERENQMKTLDLYLNEQLKNEEFRKEWEENQPEMDIIRGWQMHAFLRT